MNLSNAKSYSLYSPANSLKIWDFCNKPEACRTTTVRGGKLLFLHDGFRRLVLVFHGDMGHLHLFYINVKVHHIMFKT